MLVFEERIRNQMEKFTPVEKKNFLYNYPAYSIDIRKHYITDWENYKEMTAMWFTMAK